MMTPAEMNGTEVLFTFRGRPKVWIEWRGIGQSIIAIAVDESPWHRAQFREEEYREHLILSAMDAVAAQLVDPETARNCMRQLFAALGPVELAQ